MGHWEFGIAWFYTVPNAVAVLFEHARTLAFNTFFLLMSLMYNLLSYVQHGLLLFFFFKFSEL